MRPLVDDKRCSVFNAVAHDLVIIRRGFSPGLVDREDVVGKYWEIRQYKAKIFFATPPI